MENLAGDVTEDTAEAPQSPWTWPPPPRLPETVFAYFTDPERHTQWMGHDAERQPDAPPPLGTCDAWRNAETRRGGTRRDAGITGIRPSRDEARPLNVP